MSTGATEKPKSLHLHNKMVDLIVVKQSFLEWKILWSLLSIGVMIVGYFDKTVTGVVTLSPINVAPVCRVGDTLQLTCTSTEAEFISWSILRPGALARITNDQFINSRDPNQMSQEIVNSVTYFFNRTSSLGVLPLVSTLLINPVSSGLNGTVVRCSEVDNSVLSASTAIQIIDTSLNFQYKPVLNFHEEFYENYVIINVRWTQQLGVTYTVHISPTEPMISNGSTSGQLVMMSLFYNNRYNLSVVASTPCRPNATAVKIIKYAKCRYPELLSTERNGSVPNIVILEDTLPIENSTIHFICPSGSVLIGPDSSTCTPDGEWKPDPFKLLCNDTDFVRVSLEEGITIINNQKSLAIGISASATVLVLTCVSILTIVTIAVLHKKGSEKRKKHSESVRNKQITQCQYIDMQQTKKQAKNTQSGQNSPEQDGLIYAHVVVASKHKKSRKPRVPAPTRSNTQDLDVQYSTINYDVMVSEVEQEVEETDDNHLDVTLDTLLSLLSEQLISEWRHFGDAVGIDDIVLDSIAKTTSPHKCIVEVLDYWLKYYDGKPTWSDVTNALYDIDLPDLARNIEHLYKTGKICREEEAYVNVASVKQATKEPQLKREDKAPFDSHVYSSKSNLGKSNQSPKNPPPVASKPKSAYTLNV